jgi:hypothetical protein
MAACLREQSERPQKLGFFGFYILRFAPFCVLGPEGINLIGLPNGFAEVGASSPSECFGALIAYAIHIASANVSSWSE